MLKHGATAELKPEDALQVIMCAAEGSMTVKVPGYDSAEIRL